MKKFTASAIAALLFAGSLVSHADTAIRVNRMGYLTDDLKKAVVMVPQGTSPNLKDIAIVDVKTGKKIAPDKVLAGAAWEPMGACYTVDFSSLKTPGRYVVKGGGVVSPEFGIGDDVYAGANEVPLFYMRQQRCGFNPVLGEKCHTHDGRLVLSGKDDGKHIDVTGGWHDASDYLQYLTTSANAVFQMLFAYQQNPGIWADSYDAAGLPGKNGVPDILDEARWGLEWMIKMNPSDTLYLNQIADDRDHRFGGHPAQDNVDYGWGPGMDRPVYPCSGEPYGLQGNKNDSKGLASSVGKFSSSFSTGAEVFRSIDPAFADELERRAGVAYEVAKANPGACQTAPCISPYYYEEDNWVDDMELAAVKRYHATGDKKFRQDAIDYGRMEPVTPWMGADSAHHYQWYPFINIGHVLLAQDSEKKVSDEFIRNLKSGLDRVKERGQNNVFMAGVPFIWCSNNLTVALVTQAMLYRELTGDHSYIDLETAARDWLFGLNPWGQSMIIGMPESGGFPEDPHSPLHKQIQTDLKGGLVDGPVYANIFNSLRGVHLEREDLFAPYQNSIVVYHDDYHDYSSNEPTMDGTASMTYFLGKLASQKKNK